MMLLSILIPVVAGALLPCIKPHDMLRRIYVSSALILSVASATAAIISGGDLRLLSLAQGLDICYAVDGISVFFAFVFAAAWLLVLV